MDINYLMYIILATDTYKQMHTSRRAYRLKPLQIVNSFFLKIFDL